jgi:hypothetical protein
VIDWAKSPYCNRASIGQYAVDKRSRKRDEIPIAARSKEMIGVLVDKDALFARGCQLWWKG